MIDRASFLALTFAMAGSGCNGGGPGASVAGAVVEIPRQPAGARAASPPRSPSTDADASPDAAPRTDAADSARRGDDDHADADGDERETRNDAGTTAVGACGWVDPSTVARPTTACAEDKGVVAACAPMKACSGVTFPKMKCEAYRKYMKPRVAQRALDCLAKLSASQACDACNAYRCGELALKTSCPDPAADALCVQITHSCHALSATECRLYLAGMNAAGRAKIAGCLATSTGCAFGIMSCTEGLF